MNKLLKQRFPIFSSHPGLTYLDSAASTQKPDAVLDAVSRFYRESYANIHRGIYGLSERATSLFDRARDRTASFIGAADSRSLVFTRNATESINLVAHTIAEERVTPDSTIVVTLLEHHANFVPWQRLAEQTGARLIPVGINPETFQLDMDAMKAAITDKTAIVAVTMASNVLGTTPDVNRIMGWARDHGALTVLDAAQYVPHHVLNVADLDPDFLVFSGHKMLALDGIGVLYGRLDLLEQMDPFLTGGDMIERVTVEKTTFAPVPQRFEAGTPFIGGAVSLAAAIDFLDEIGMETVRETETRLARHAADRLMDLGGITLYRDPMTIHNGILPFNINGVHPHDSATIMAEMDVCVRAGHHCAAPLIDELDEMAIVRASFYLYNDADDIDRLVNAVKRVKEVFRK